MAHLFLVVTKGFSSNYPEAGFSYKTWELYIYVCISTCIISQKPLERVRNHKTTSAVIRGIFNPSGKTAQNRKASPDLGGWGWWEIETGEQKVLKFLLFVVFVFSFGLLIKSSKAAWQ